MAIEYREGRIFSTNSIMGIPPGAEFRVRSKILTQEVHDVVVLDFELEDDYIIDPGLTWVRAIDRKDGGRVHSYSLQALLNGMGGSDHFVDVEWLNPPEKSDRIKTYR